jgi:hypothetical protein
MATYILHGGFEREDNELNNTFYQELLKDIPENGRLLLVHFASTHTPGEVKEVHELQTKRLQTLAGKNINVEFATEEDFLEQVRNADAVHMRGGHTPKLLATLKKYPELQSLFSTKTVSGSSAGAYALAAYGVGHSEEGIREGLGIVPVRLICHYESEELPPDPESCIKLENMDSRLELVKLRDFEWRIFN